MPRALDGVGPCFRVGFWQLCCSVNRGRQPYYGRTDVMRQGSQVDRRVAQVSTADSVLNPRRGQAAQVSGLLYSQAGDTRIGYMARRIVSVMRISMGKRV
jgi:hypothetical protein